MKAHKIVKAGLIGYPLGHSFSKGYFTSRFEKESLPDYEYRNFEINDIRDLKDVVKNNKDLIGLNVTIPYKQSVMDYLDDISGEADKIGAVNTIVIRRRGNDVWMSGHNTDHIGFEKTLEQVLSVDPAGALILGTGGASKAVRYVLDKRGIKYYFVSRDPGQGQLSYREINGRLIKEFPLIINTSPVGMFPHVNEKPEIPYSDIGPDNCLIDLIYNPEKTKFLEGGERAGAKTINGLTMLIEQAEASWKLWTSNDHS